jgi:putative heme degradation protein
VKTHDFVFYVRDPELYGVMQVRKVRSDGMVVCRVDLDRDGVFVYEVFGLDELGVTARAKAAV